MTAVLLGLPLWLAGCSDQQVAAEVQAPKVIVSTPVAKEVMEWDEYTGRLQPIEVVEVRARVSGYLESIHFKDGDIVKEDDLLFIIDPRPYKAEHDRAVAQLALAQAQLQVARSDLRRALKARDARAISGEEVDQRRSRAMIAQAGFEGAEAAVESAALNLAFTRVTAPITGRISRDFVSEGNLINGGTPEATLLTTIVSLDPIYCYFEADERSYLKYVRLSRSGARASGRDFQHPVYLALADQTGFPHEGYLDFVDNRLDPATGTMTARALFANPDFALTPGLFARVRLVGSGRYEALLLPEEAIGTDLSQRYVFVVNDQSVVQYRTVELGPLIGGLRVIRNGLEGAERVIISGIQKARNGSRVSPVPGEITYQPEVFDLRPAA